MHAWQHLGLPQQAQSNNGREFCGSIRHPALDDRSPAAYEQLYCQQEQVICA